MKVSAFQFFFKPGLAVFLIILPLCSIAASENASSPSGKGDNDKIDGLFEASSDTDPVTETTEADSDPESDAQLVEIQTPAPVNPYLLPAKHGKSEARRLYEKGVDFIRKENWREAALVFKALRKSRRISTWNSRSRLLLAYSLIRLGNDEEAVGHLGKVLGDFAYIKYDLRWMMAESLFRLGRYKRALPHYRRITRAYKGNKPIYKAMEAERPYFYDAEVRQIECLLKLGYNKSVITRTLEMETDYKEDGFNKPDFCVDDLSWLRSQAYRASGKEELELSLLRRINLLGPYCRYSDDLADRLDKIRKSGISLAPSYGAELVSHLSFLRKIWAHDEIVKLVEEAERKYTPQSPEHDPAIHMKLANFKAKAFLSIERCGEAAAIFRKLYDEDRNGGKAKGHHLYNLAKALGRMNRLEEAGNVYMKLYETFPKSPLAIKSFFLSGWILGHAPGQIDDASDRLEAFHTAYPRNYMAPKALWFRAWYAFQADNFTVALELLDELKTKYPRSGYRRAGRYWTGRIHEKTGFYEKAYDNYLELAREESFNYYRLLAIDRLKEFVKPEKTTDLSNGTGAAKPKAPTGKKFGSVGVKTSFGNYARRKFLAEFSEDRPPYSLHALRNGFTEQLYVLEDYFAKRERRRRIRLNKIINKLKGVFPDLKGAFVFRNLGLESEAGRKLERFLKLDAFLEKHSREVKYKNEREEDFGLRRKRLELLEKHAERLHPCLLGTVVEWGNLALAYSIYSRNLSRQQRRSMPKRIRHLLYYPPSWTSLIEKAAERHDVPDDLLISVMRTESTFNPNVVSYANAIGLMQIMPHTGIKISREKGDDDFYRARLFKPEISTDYGAWYLGALLRKFHRQLPLAIASYNGGPHNVATWLKRNPGLEWDEFIESIEFIQTRHYVKKVLKTMAVYRFLYTGEYSAWNFNAPIEYQCENNIDF